MSEHEQPTAWAISRALVRCAARQAPPGLAQRLEEEWLADLTARQSALGRLRFGLGCCWATRVIAREFGVAAAASAGSASGQQLLVAAGGYDFSRLSRRTVALIAILCLHAGIFYLYLNGFTPSRVVDRIDLIHGSVITRNRRLDQPRLLPVPTLAPINDSVPDRIPRLPAQPPAITVTHSPPSGKPLVQYPPPKPVNVIMGGPAAGFPNTEDYYPSAARRLGESGSAAVRVCVDPNGRLTAAPTIVRSSGLARIDQGALRLATAGSGHYRPTMENGRPVSACYPFLIRFQLENQ